MTKLRLTVQLALAVLFAAALSAAPGQLREFRMAAQIDHFDITCPPEFDRQAISIGRQAESAYQRVSARLQHDLSFRPLLVLFATGAERTGAIETRTVPGNREHVLVTLDTPEPALAGHFVHELSHVFLFDVLPPTLHRDIPVWILEGLAEHQRGEWNEDDRTALREMVDRGTLPKLSRVDTPESDARRSAAFGHAAFDFLAEREGADAVRRFFISLRERPPVSAFLRELDLSPADFDNELDLYLSRLF
jgi:hypothetical protein